jgi:hypothetical protein
MSEKDFIEIERLKRNNDNYIIIQLGFTYRRLLNLKKRY